MRTKAPDAATLDLLVSAAAAAPSLHNTQPWRYRFDPDTVAIEVRADTARALPQTDPAGRALHISVGAALFNLRVAVAHTGREPVVRLLPHPADPGLLASVRMAGQPSDDDHDGRRGRELYDALWRRHSSRHPFSGRQVPPAVTAELVDAALAEGARLRLPGPAETVRILQLTAEAERRGASDPGRAAESRDWVREGATDGLPTAALGPQDAEGHLPVRDFTALRPAPRPPAEAFETHPAIAVLGTRHDRRADWLRAGLALEHVLLVATAHGVRTSLLHQAVEWPDLRWALRDVHEGIVHVHMLIRFGYGPQGASTPRRPVVEVLDLPPARDD
jgi:nitroreductase